MKIETISLKPREEFSAGGWGKAEPCRGAGKLKGIKAKVILRSGKGVQNVTLLFLNLMQNKILC